LSVDARLILKPDPTPTITKMEVVRSSEILALGYIITSYKNYSACNNAHCENFQIN